MEKRLALQFVGEDGNWWTHRHVGFWSKWLCWFYNAFPRFTPENSEDDLMLKGILSYANDKNN